MAANPYASFLGNRDPLEVIAATPGRLQTLVQTLGASGLKRSPAPGKWSARQIFCHLADCEIAFAFRLRQALAEDGHVIQPFDQDAWAVHYDAYDADAALGLFRALRNWNRRLIVSLPPAAMTKVVTHPERGDMTFRVLVETMAGHDLNHLGQLEKIASVR